jgi:hypothetical protein
MQSESILVCKECLEEIRILKSGDEQWLFCENCQAIEGEVIELDSEEFQET